MAVHVCICLCLKYASTTRRYASHTGAAVGSGKAAHPGATGGACHTSQDIYTLSRSLPISLSHTNSHTRARAHAHILCEVSVPCSFLLPHCIARYVLQVHSKSSNAHNQDVQGHAKTDAAENRRLRTLDERAWVLKQADARAARGRRRVVNRARRAPNQTIPDTSWHMK